MAHPERFLLKAFAQDVAYMTYTFNRWAYMNIAFVIKSDTILESFSQVTSNCILVFSIKAKLDSLAICFMYQSNSHLHVHVLNSMTILFSLQKNNSIFLFNSICDNGHRLSESHFQYPEIDAMIRNILCAIEVTIPMKLDQKGKQYPDPRLQSCKMLALNCLQLLFG